MNAIELIYILGLAFGVASIFVLFYQIKPPNKRLVIYLSGYLLVLGTSNLMVVLLGTGLMIHVAWLYKLLMPFSFLAPVWGLWYVRGTLGQLKRLKLRDYVHLLPFVLVVIHYLPFYLIPIEEKREIVASVIANTADVVNLSNGWIFSETQIYLLRSIQTAFYVLWSWQAIKHFEGELYAPITDRRTKIVVRWLRFFVRMKAIYLFSVLLCYLLLGLQFTNVFFNEIVTQVLFLLTAALVFILSSYLLLHPKSLLSIEKPIQTQRDSGQLLLSIDEVINQIRKEEWYTDAGLTQPMLLNQLNIKLTDFSALLKLSGYENFNGFINSLRLEAFIDRATTAEVERSSIEGIANACGFRSSSTFYRVFKEKYQCTPKQYLERA
jgi:AraC-like DNA-binding protein